MGPEPSLWTGFVFVYAALVALFVGGTTYGLVQASLGEVPTGGWAAGAALVGLTGACGLDLLGRRLGRDQMDAIRSFVIRTLPDAEECDPPAL